MKIYVGNLPWITNGEHLEELFSKFGEIERAYVITDKHSGLSKGYGFVEFVNDDDAKKAIEEMDQSEYEGKDGNKRIIKVNSATPIEDENTKPAPKKETKTKENKIDLDIEDELF